MTYILDNDLLDVVAARLGSTAARITAEAAQWPKIIHDANLDAYNRIRTDLVARGFTIAQIDTWDRRREFNRRGGLCLALTEGAVLRSVDMAAVDKICEVWDELAEVPILVVDEEVVPTGSSGVSHGDMTRPDDAITDESWRTHGGLVTTGGADDTCPP